MTPNCALYFYIICVQSYKKNIEKKLILPFLFQIRIIKKRMAAM